MPGRHHAKADAMQERLEGPLAGVRVADFSRVLAGPYATMLLADFGADVIKVESPSGDDTRDWLPPVDAAGRSTYFGGVNRNKRSVVLDLADAAGLAEARRLAASADVVVENFRPGVMARFGLDYDGVRAVEPGRRVLLDHGIRHRRRRDPRGLRPARAGGRRAHEHHRRARRRARARSASPSSTCSPGRTRSPGSSSRCATATAPAWASSSR